MSFKKDLSAQDGIPCMYVSSTPVHTHNEKDFHLM